MIPQAKDGNLNGATVHYSEPEAVIVAGVRAFGAPTTIFLPLPRSMWREFEGPCRCSHCAKVPGRKGYWDTLAMATRPKKGSKSGYAYTVHRPEQHPEGLEGEETER